MLLCKSITNITNLGLIVKKNVIEKKVEKDHCNISGELNLHPFQISESWENVFRKLSYFIVVEIPRMLNKEILEINQEEDCFSSLLSFICSS